MVANSCPPTVARDLFRSPFLGQILVPKNADHFQIIKRLYLMISQLLRRIFFGHHSWVRFWFSKRGPLSNPKRKVIFSDFATVVWILFRSPLLGQILVPKNANHFPTQKKRSYSVTSQLLVDKFCYLFSDRKASRILGPPSGRGEKDFGDRWLAVVVVAGRGAGWWLVVATTTSRDYY